MEIVSRAFPAVFFQEREDRNVITLHGEMDEIAFSEIDRMCKLLRNSHFHASNPECTSRGSSSSSIRHRGLSSTEYNCHYERIAQISKPSHREKRKRKESG